MNKYHQLQKATLLSAGWFVIIIIYAGIILVSGNFRNDADGLI